MTARLPLDRALIVDAALRVVDAGGMAALSMRKLAAELGVVPGALYGHVAGRGELLQLVLDRVVGEVDLTVLDPALPWTEQVKQLSRELRHTLTGHRDLAGAAIGIVPVGTNWMRLHDVLIGLLRAGGLPDRECAYAIDLLPEFVANDVYETTLFEARLAADPNYLDTVTAYLVALPTARFPQLATLVPTLSAQTQASTEDRFEFGLAVLVNGVASLAAT